MSEMGAAISPDGSALLAALQRITDAVESGAQDPDIRAGMLEALDIADRENQTRFAIASQHGGPWSDLAESTKRKRYADGASPRERRHDPATMFSKGWTGDELLIGGFFPILFISGHLYESLIMGASDHFLEIDGGVARSGTMVYFAHFHQNREGHNPLRQIIQPHEESAQVAMAEAVGVGVAAAISRIQSEAQ